MSNVRRRDRELARIEREDTKARARAKARNMDELRSLRSIARGDDHTYRLNGGARPLARQLDHHEIHVGMVVLARGTLGVVESIAWSVASEAFLYVVAHDPRMRLTYRIGELAAAP